MSADAGAPCHVCSEPLIVTEPAIRYEESKFRCPRCWTPHEYQHRVLQIAFAQWVDAEALPLPNETEQVLLSAVMDKREDAAREQYELDEAFREAEEEFLLLRALYSRGFSRTRDAEFIDQIVKGPRKP